MISLVDNISTWLDLRSVTSVNFQTADFLVRVVQKSTWACSPGGKLSISSRRNGHFCFRASNLACRGSSCPFWPLPCVFKNVENARTIRSKSSQASGRRAKTPHVRFVLCFTARTGLRPQNPRVFIGFREAVPGPPKRPPKRLPGARPPKPRGQAPKRQK